MRVWVAIWVGSSALSRIVCEWLARGIVVRLLGVGLGAGFTRGITGAGPLVTVAAVVWLALAVRLGLLAEPRTPEETEQPKTRPEPTRNEVTTLLHGALQEKGGVHLKTLSKSLPNGPWPTADVRALLARHEIRVRAGVRVPGTPPLEGVHRDDIPPLPPRSPGDTVVGVVVPGQTNNNNTESDAGDDNREGFSITRDPVKRHRWQVIHRVRRDH